MNNYDYFHAKESDKDVIIRDDIVDVMSLYSNNPMPDALAKSLKKLTLVELRLLAQWLYSARNER